MVQHRFGVGLTPGDLDAIHHDHHSADLCFRAMLKLWLSRSKLKPSWNILARSLRAPPVGLGHLAEQIQDLAESN